MDPQRFWILVGICLGGGAGIMGAYIGWRRAFRRSGRRGKVITTVSTLFFAIGLGSVALAVRTAWWLRVLLLVPPAVLGYWFVRQVAELRGAGPGLKRTGRGV